MSSSLEGPGRCRTTSLLRIVSRKEAVIEIVLVVHDIGGIRVVVHVLVEVLVVVQDVLDHTAKEGDVGAGPQSGVDVRLGGCLGKPGIHGNEVAPLSLAFMHPFHGDGMVFGSIAAHDQDSITVLEIDPVIGHCAAPERLCQSRNSGAVSYTGLVVDVDQAQGPHHRVAGPAFLVVEGTLPTWQWPPFG